MSENTEQNGADSHLLTVEEAAEILRVCKGTVYNWTRKGLMPSIKIGKSIRVDSGQLNDWINARVRDVPVSSG